MILIFKKLTHPIGIALGSQWYSGSVSPLLVTDHVSQEVAVSAAHLPAGDCVLLAVPEPGEAAGALPAPSTLPAQSASAPGGRGDTFPPMLFTVYSSLLCLLWELLIKPSDFLNIP